MPTKTKKLTPAGQSPVLALALGSAAWLRAQADDREEMLHALGAFDEEGERETKREILGLRDAADRIEKMERQCERQAATIRHMEAQIDAYEEDAIP